MQNDLISRSALKKTFEAAGFGDHSLIESVLAAGVYAGIENAPTIDAVPVVHGKWERCFEDWRHQLEGDKCSACGFEHYGIPIDHYLYCPNCGAKMDGGAADA